MKVKPGYRQTEVAVIPVEWRLSCMGDEAALLTGFPFPSSGFTKAGVRLLRGSNVKRGVVDWSPDITRYWPSIEGDIYSYALREGDLVIAMDGALVGRSFATITTADIPALLVQRVARLRSKGADPYILRAWVASDFFARHVDLVKTHTAIPHISPKDIRSFILVIPTCETEQRAIGTALSDVDVLLNGLDRLIAKKRDLRQAAMQQLLTGRTRLPGFRERWEVKRLGDVAGLNRVSVTPASEPNQPFVHFSLPAFDHGKTAQVELGSTIGSNKFRVPPNSVLLSKLNPRIPRIWAPENVPENACASTEWLVLTPRAGTERDFLFSLCSSPAFCQQMELAATGTTGSHQRISPNSALDIRVAVPTDQKEQAAIALVLSTMDAELAALGARRAKTRELKQAMMQELLTGKTRLVKPEAAHA